MEWVAGALRENMEIALFLSLAVGHGIGALRVGSFHLGPVLGTLMAGLLVGQIGVDVPAAMQSTFFLLFLFAIGFRTGPEFFRSVRSTAIPQVALTVLLCVTALGVTWAIAGVFDFDGATAAGLLAGAMTNSTALGTATTATANLGLDSAATAQLSDNIATTYALTYVLGTLLVVWFLPHVGPRLMRVNLRDASRSLDQTPDEGARRQAMNAAYRRIETRTFRLPPNFSGRTVTEIESLWPPGQRVVIGGVRRADAFLDPDASLRLQANDIVAVAGRASALVGDGNPLKDEVDDRDLLGVPTVSADLVLTNRSFAGESLQRLAEEVSARHIFLIELRRAGRELPFSPSTIVERGDVMTVTGTRPEIHRIAARVGFAEYPTSSTDLLLVAATIVAGGMIGLPALAVGGLTLSLSVPVGVLLAGLTLGQLRSIHPRFGRIPEPAAALFESLGLAGFLALVGLQAGPGMLAAFRHTGIRVLVAGALITLLPHVITILVGRFVVGMHPAILLGLCAGAGTSAPALAAIEAAAGSRTPTLGYGLACAVGNVLMAMSGTLLVLAGHG